jgi:acyl-CoA thioesterase
MRLRFAQLARHAVHELGRRLRSSNTSRLFGFALEAAEPGRAVVTMRVQPRHIQVHGVVHGGVLAALADTAAALAAYLALPRGTRLATVELKINFLEPVEKGRLLAEGRLLRKGKNLAVAECDIRDAASRLIAKALLTYAISRAARGRKRGKLR